MEDAGAVLIIPNGKFRFIAVLAVKCREKTYLGIHRMTEKYWSQIAKGLDLSVISESQLRERLKKICHEPGKPAGFILQIFPAKFFD